MVMSDRIHRATSAGGTEIAGHVYGQGPPLFFVHGGIGDEDSWRLVIPFLSERFTCYPLSLRGRGLSADSPRQVPRTPWQGRRGVCRRHRRPGRPRRALDERRRARARCRVLTDRVTSSPRTCCGTPGRPSGICAGARGPRVLEVHVGPQPGATIGEVPGGCEHLLSGQGGFGHVDGRGSHRRSPPRRAT